MSRDWEYVSNFQKRHNRGGEKSSVCGLGSSALCPQPKEITILNLRSKQFSYCFKFSHEMLEAHTLLFWIMHEEHRLTILLLLRIKLAHSIVRFTYLKQGYI